MENVESVLAEAGSGAEAFINSGRASGATEGTSQLSQATSQPATPVLATPQQATQQTPPQQLVAETPAITGPAPLALDDATTYAWTNPATGATEPKTGKEIKAGWMMHGDYTRKSQENAALRKDLDPYIREREQVAAILQNPQAYLQFAAQQLGPQALSQLAQALQQMQQAPQAQPAFNPNELATTGQAQELAQRHAAAQFQQMQQQLLAMQQQLERNVETSAQQIRDEQQMQRHMERIDPVVKAIFTEHPILAATPNAEDSIRFSVRQQINAMKQAGMTPTEADAINMLKQTGAQYAAQITAKFEELQKAQAVKANALVTNGIEPPGGTPLQHQSTPQTPLRPDGKVDFDALGSQVEAFLNSRRAK